MKRFLLVVMSGFSIITAAEHEPSAPPPAYLCNKGTVVAQPKDGDRAVLKPEKTAVHFFSCAGFCENGCCNEIDASSLNCFSCLFGHVYEGHGPKGKDQ